MAKHAVFAFLSVFMATAIGQNIVTNPSAETLDDNGRPVGWGRYVGAGECEFATTEELSHSGKRCAVLKMTKWHEKKAEGDKRSPRSCSVGIMIGDSDGYRGPNALPAEPGKAYAFTFWVKGDVPCVRASGVTWKTEAADLDSRSVVSVGTGVLNVTSEWQWFGGRFRMPDDAKRFVLGIYASCKEADGEKLGTVYVDDVAIWPVDMLDTELRAIWYGSVRAKTEEEGMKEIRDSISMVKSAGFNAIFASEGTLYLAALKDEKCRELLPRAGWDSLGKVVQEAKAAGLQVHLWYSPWIYKRKSSAVELIEHPEWAAVDIAGKPSNEGVCAARPEVREFQLKTVLEFIERYPRLDGIHLEEPGYPWGEYCFCDYCRQKSKDLLGFDFKERPDDPARSHFKAFVCNDLVFRLRREMLRRAPHMLLSCNGSAGADPDWYIGRDWLRLARFSAIDFYVPQVYTTKTEVFTQRLQETIEAANGRCKVCGGLAITYSGIYPNRNTPEELASQIEAARRVKAAGIVVFHRYHLTDKELPALTKVLKKE